MDTNVNVKIIRDDLRQFDIDNTTWHIPGTNGLQNFGYFENDITTIDNAITDGAMISAYRMGTIDRTIVFHNTQPRKSNDVLRKTVLSFFSTKHTYKIYVTYMGVTRWCEGMVLKCDVPTLNINWEMEITVTFLCNNPYLKSYDDFGKDIASILPMAGFPYLSTVKKGSPTGAFAFSKFVVLNNDGDTDTRFKAVFKAFGFVRNPKLFINDNFVRVITNLNNGDEIEMDFTKAPPSIKKNGQNCIGLCDRKSSFDEMYLGIGDTEVAYDADEGTNLVSVSIYYNKLYSGI